MAGKAEIILTAQDRTNGAFRSIERNFSGLRTASLTLNRALGGIGAALGVRELASMADSFQNIQARLRLATRDANEFATANENISRIAASAKNPLEATATLYTRISQSLLDVGGTQAQVANTTQAMALGLRLSGATAAESASAMLQFSQAIGSGVLRGEEFNALNEAAPRIMKALADSMGVPIGQLREMAKEGQITRDVLVEALGAELPRLIAEAETLPNTLSSSFTELKNELVLIIGELDKVTGASGSAANFISSAGGAALKAIALFGANAIFVFREVSREIGGVGERLAALASGDFRGFDQIGQRLKREAQEARREFAALQDQIVGVGKATEAKPEATGSRERVKGLLEEAAATGKVEAERKKLQAAAKAALQADQSAIQSLRSRLLTTRELSEVEQAGEEIREGRYKNLSASAKQQLLTIAAQIDAQKALNQAEEDQADIQKRLTDEGVRRFQELEAAGLRVYEATRTDAEKYAAEVIRLNELLAEGTITQETYNRAVDAAQSSYQKATENAQEANYQMSQFSLQAARNMQSHFADFLFDPFDKGVEGMALGFINAIRRMAAEAAAAQIFNSLFGGFGAGPGGGGILGGLVGALFKGATSILGFAEGGHHSGGLRIVGERGPELELTGPSRIFNAQQTRDILSGSNSRGGDNITVQVHVHTGVQQTVRAEFLSLIPVIRKEAVAAVAQAKQRGYIRLD